jgi:two-component system, OmpR family, sensor histidine kinase VanS
VARTPGLSVRLKFTLSYVGFLTLAVALLAAAAWVSRLQGAFAPKGAAVLAFLLLFALAGGWVLAGRMLAP